VRASARKSLAWREGDLSGFRFGGLGSGWNGGARGGTDGSSHAFPGGGRDKSEHCCASGEWLRDRYGDDEVANLA